MDQGRRFGIFLLCLLQKLFEAEILSAHFDLSRSRRFDSSEINKLFSVPNSSETGFVPSTRFLPSFYEYSPSSIIPNTFHTELAGYPAQSYYHHNQKYAQPSHEFPSHPLDSNLQYKTFHHPHPYPIEYFQPHRFTTESSLQRYPGTNAYPSSTYGPPTNPLSLSNTRHFEYPSHYHHEHFPLPLPAPPSPFTDGFEVGALYKKVKVPGIMRVDILGKDAEITCEFPKYLLLIQGIYWHHRYNDPFGSYFDTQNGFGAHVTVRQVDQWKSVLVIQDYSVDDAGFYRCLSAAVLPAATEPLPEVPPSVFTPKKSYDAVPQDLNKQPPVLPLTVVSPPSYEFDSGVLNNEVGTATAAEQEVSTSPENEKKARVSRFSKNSRQMRFPPLEETTKPRFSRAARNPTSRNRRYYSYADFANNPYSTEESNYRRLTNPYVDGFQQHVPSSSRLHQTKRHLPYPYPEIEYGIPFPPLSYPQPASPHTTGFGLKVPFFKPSFSYFTIYQEMMFQPSGVASRSIGHGRARRHSLH